MKLRRLRDYSLLKDFHCGVQQMDEFIQQKLQYSIEAHFCVPYIVIDDDDIVAFFALSYDSLAMPSAYFDDFLNGFSSSGTPNIPFDYHDTFEHKEHYPAIDVAYFAVSEQYQRKHIGSEILEDIIQFVKDHALAGCQFIVVDALVTSDYSAMSFYAKNKFTVCEDKKPYKDCVRMYRVLYPKL